MEVYEKINQILLSRTISKRDFAKKLRAIEPKLKSTGEVPTEKAIYGLRQLKTIDFSNISLQSVHFFHFFIDYLCF